MNNEKSWGDHVVLLFPIFFQFNIYPPVVIEDDVWIGGHVIINAGRRIRKGTIVAAGSVVTKDFPEYSIIGGNPVKLIKIRKEM